MRAIVLDGKGGPEVLALRDVPEPEPGPEEVVVAVVATALNRADLLQRRGLYPGPSFAGHEVPGLEYAGRVVAAGERVTGARLGDEVMGIVTGGGYAERLAVHERQTMPVPAAVGLADAAAVPEVFLTAWDALVLQGGLTSGRTALVHAGASGVGTAAIQLCRALGASVVVTASAGKLDRCRELGADLAVDRDGDWVAAMRERTRGRGADVVLDVVGGAYLPRNIEALAVKGRIVQVGVMDPAPVPFSPSALLPKRATLVGTVLRARPIEEKIAVTQRFAAEVLPLFERGVLRPVIDRRYPLAEVADAHRYMESNANVGKILVDVGAVDG